MLLGFALGLVGLVDDMRRRRRRRLGARCHGGTQRARGGSRSEPLSFGSRLVRAWSADAVVGGLGGVFVRFCAPLGVSDLVRAHVVLLYSFLGLKAARSFRWRRVQVVERARRREVDRPLWANISHRRFASAAASLATSQRRSVRLRVGRPVARPGRGKPRVRGGPHQRGDWLRAHIRTAYMPLPPTAPRRPVA